MKYSTWLWPAILLLSAGVTWSIYTLYPGSPARPLVVAWFFVICPGMAVIRFLRLQGRIAEYTLATAASLTTEALMSCIQIYTHTWSPTVALNILVGICVVGALLQLVFLRPTTRSVGRPIRVA